MSADFLHNPNTAQTSSPQMKGAEKKKKNNIKCAHEEPTQSHLSLKKTRKHHPSNVWCRLGIKTTGALVPQGRAAAHTAEVAEAARPALALLSAEDLPESEESVPVLQKFLFRTPASLPNVLVAVGASEVNPERLLSTLGSDLCPQSLPLRDFSQRGGGRPCGKANARQRLRQISSLLLRSELGLGFARPSPISVA